MSEAFDYKASVFLPKTVFPMRGNLPKNEPNRLRQWHDEEVYQGLRQRRQGAPKFILHDGPPYANGHIHIGHAVNKVLKDIIIRSRSMMGFDAPYVPGWDCHGLPIEHKVEEAFKKKKRDLTDGDAFRKACREYASQWLDVQRDEFKRLGIWGDWQQPYITMDFAFEANTVRELGRFLHNGGLYKGAKPVHWCVNDKTALAEAEVEYEDHESHSIHVKFAAAEDLSDVHPALAGQVSVVIWTTTPWTIPANLAVALGAHLEYAAVRITQSDHACLAMGEVLILAADLYADILAEFKVEGEVLAHFSGKELEHKRFRHPYLDQDAPIVLGDHVTLDAGTGCVHTAPGHGQEDYEVGLLYGLKAFNPVGDNGVFAADTPVLGGQHVSKANELMIEHLRACGALLADGKVIHSYPHCWRCHKPLIFRATPQWFISMSKNDLRQQALAAIEQTQFIPDWGRKRMAGMVEQRPDWCVSRQRKWGVPITVVRCDDCGSHAVSDEAMIERVAKQVEQHGADIWFTADLSDFLGEQARCPDCGGQHFTRESDILDVWFDSGSSHACVLEQRPELQSPADLYLEGSDQHRGWFQSSLLESMGTRQKAPFKAVLTHGFTVDAQGNKMSKSRGNVIAPQKIIDQYGADILRLWVAGSDYSADIRVSNDLFKQLSESYRRIRNTIRFLLGNVDGFDTQRDAVPVSERGSLDRWIMHRLHRLCTSVQADYEAYQFHHIHQQIHHFCAVDLGGFYLDVIKDRVYCDASDSQRRRSTRATLHDLLTALIRMIAPILPFTAEEAWQCFEGDQQASVHWQLFYESQDVAIDEQAWTAFFALREQINTALDQAKKDGLIGSGMAAKVTAKGLTEDLAASLGEPLEQLLIIAQAKEGEQLNIEAIEGIKCPRCWNVCTPIHPDHEQHADLCERCFEVVTTA